jgi:hypothetical protein
MISKDIKQLLENKTNFGHMLNIALTPMPIPNKIAKAENINLKNAIVEPYYNPKGSFHHEIITIRDTDNKTHHFIHDGKFYAEYDKKTLIVISPKPKPILT